MSMAKKVKMLEQEREQWQAELRAVMGRERAQIEAARAADKARIAELMGLLNDAACRMALTGFEPGLCESMFAVLAQQSKENTDGQ
ncbi:MAG: hypothetical protein CMK78_11360 [Pseudomonadales bacterium]|nr:hypothetical protein [Pseudomonadales bacterium]|tara:strand:- start:2536 stop:2793 length:258 start_codon:yes stop_codon:yes gene_type:complete